MAPAPDTDVDASTTGYAGAGGRTARSGSRASDGRTPLTTDDPGRVREVVREFATTGYDAARSVGKRAVELYLRRRYGADFSGYILLANVGYDAPERIEYLASPWFGIHRVLRRLGLGPDDVVADLGAGKGLGVLAASMHPVRRVVGVEIVPDFADEARATVERNRARLEARSVEVVTGDATAWPVPDDLTVVYMFSPFIGETFGAVLANLLESVERHPRPLRFVYVYPQEHDRVLATGRARVLDVQTVGVRRPGWWKRDHVVVTYGLGPGPFPAPAGRCAPAGAMQRWSVPVSGRDGNVA